MDDSTDIKKLSDFIPIRLKIARMARGFSSRSACAQACNAAITTYRAHERGDYELKASDIIRYTRYLDISIPWLLTGKGHPLDHQAHPDREKLALFLYYLHLEGSKEDFQHSAVEEATAIINKNN
ncbi:MAG: helix-turn-helix transcriptional regulator [Proteobacteria bacterium]|nr:helix-turn-helix transcriptional regulator [Pseudomonadota bacterium]